ncbi:signal peptidase II [Olleya marilimosa]|uniref:Lipoprotein signal peptidase n=1 Tax=Olleya marilimosa TaxID=272164 RepID=A0ABR8LWQ2_9FLAO|nr:signal peptidase II [Olleya marilimosa]MBD3864598.1 signal peptidase II [Olleya marilimosa]MBD3892079.1 signal peptidase II [Olleya marilimosa]
MSSRNILILGLVVFNIILDQVSKFIVRVDVIAGSETEIFGQYFTLHNVENKGAFLGMGSDFSPTLRIALLLVLPIIVLALVLRHIIKDKTINTMTLVGFCCIVGGGLANVYDRVVYGSVTDFLHIDLGSVFRTGIFNLADVSVMVGMGCLILGSFKNKKA